MWLFFIIQEFTKRRIYVYLANDPHKMRSLGEHNELPFGFSFKCMDEPNPKHVRSL
jgi:hypothetical protein